MTGQNGPIADDPIAAILAPLAERLAEVQHERLRVKTELELLDVEVRRIERVLRAADPDAPKSPRKTSGKKNVSEDTIDRVLAAARSRGDETFTVGELAGDLGDKTTSAVQTAVKTLRERELVRMIGRVPLERGKRGLAPYGYRNVE